MLNIITRYLFSGVIKVTLRNVIIMQTGLKKMLKIISGEIGFSLKND